MIYGQLNRLEEYLSKEPRLKEVLSFMEKNNLKTLAEGKYNIAGHSLYVNIDKYNTQLFEERDYEIHQKYIDVQCILEGNESIFIEKSYNLEEKIPYNEEKDIAFLENGINAVEVKMYENDFLVIYPMEAHKPCIKMEQVSSVKKAVFKIYIGEL